MKKILFAFLLLLSFSGFSQVRIETVSDTTRGDGQQFVVTYPYDVRINLVDSLYIPAGDSVMRVREGYYSKLNSTLSVKCQRKRITTTTNAADNTIIKYDWITISFSQLGTKPEGLLNGTLIKKALKPTIKEWVKYKLNQE